MVGRNVSQLISIEIICPALHHFRTSLGIADSVEGFTDTRYGPQGIIKIYFIPARKAQLTGAHKDIEIKQHGQPGCI